MRGAHAKPHDWCEVWRRVLLGVLLCTVIAAIIALTLQPPEQTVALSNWLRSKVVRLGFNPSSHQLRSDIHVPMYFVLGVVLSLYGRARGWRLWMVLLVGCAIGALDECLKIALPTREFDWVDLCKDCVGIALASFLIFENAKSGDTELRGSS